MNTLYKNVVIGMMLMAVQLVALAADRGTSQEAVALVQRGVAYANANGKDKLLAEASNQKGQFVDRDLYLIVFDMNGKVLAHGANARLIGVDGMQIRDANEKYFMKEIIAKARTAGNGWVDYKWVNPVSKQLDDKSLYLFKSDDVVIAAGIYKQ